MRKSKNEFKTLVFGTDSYHVYLLHIRNMISVVLLILMFNSAHFAKMIAKLLQ